MISEAKDGHREATVHIGRQQDKGQISLEKSIEWQLAAKVPDHSLFENVPEENGIDCNVWTLYFTWPLAFEIQHEHCSPKTMSADPGWL